MSHPTNTQVHTSIKTTYIHQQESTPRARRAAAPIFLVMLKIFLVMLKSNREIGMHKTRKIEVTLT
jgi:hypothetical protein